MKRLIRASSYLQNSHLNKEENEFAKLIFDAIGKPDFGVNITQGKIQNCFENARQEYLAQKEIGNNPSYIIGDAIIVDYAKIKEYVKWNEDVNNVIAKLGHNSITHAWVEVDNKIIDSTPFTLGVGNLNELPTGNVQDICIAAKYTKNKEVIPESTSVNWNEPFSWFPK